MMEAKNHIDISEGICSGRPRVSGTRLRVSRIVLLSEQGRSPDEIITDYPQLSLADVYAALAFYHDNREAIDEQIRDDLEFVTMMRGSEADGTSVSS